MTPAKPSASLQLVLQQACHWVAASIFQRERLAALLEAQLAIDTATWTMEDRVAYEKANFLPREGPPPAIREFFEGYFFLCAVHQVRRWLPVALRGWPSLGPDVATFETATPDVGDVRDMQTHEEEYLAGRGRKAASYRVKPQPGFWLETNAHTIMVRGNDYLLGGRVNLAATLAALRAIRPHLEAAYRDHVQTLDSGS